MILQNFEVCQQSMCYSHLVQSIGLRKSRKK